MTFQKITGVPREIAPSEPCTLIAHSEGYVLVWSIDPEDIRYVFNMSAPVRLPEVSLAEVEALLASAPERTFTEVVLTAPKPLVAFFTRLALANNPF